MDTLVGSKTDDRFDVDGFLLDLQEWNPELAVNLAESDGLQHLTQSHWNIIYYFRAHYFENQTLPVISHVCRTFGMPSHCVVELFKDFKEVWRISGLPNPGEEAKTYM